MTKRKPKKRVKKVVHKPVVRPSTKNFPSLLAVIKQNWIQALILFILGFGLYSMSIPYGYLLDDQIVITDNSYTKQGTSGIWKLLSRESFEGYFGGEQKDLVAGARYRPLSLVTFAVEYQFAGLNPRLSHALNALFFAITVLILFEILILFFEWRSKKKKVWYLSIPFWAAVIFALHPIHTEAVANIKGRDEILALLFSLAALRTFISYSIQPAIKLLIGASLLLFLGLLAKENTITYCAVIPMALFVFRFTDLKSPAFRNSLIALLAVAVLYLVIRTNVIGYFLDSGKEITELMNNPFVEMNGGEKIATIFYTLIMYIRLLFWPDPLCHDYYPYAIAIKDWADVTVWISFLLHLAMLVYGLIALRRKKIISFLLLYYLVTLSIVSNFVFPVGTFMNERFLFMPSVAFAVFVPWFLLSKVSDKFSQITSIKTISLGVLILYSVVLGFLSIQRIPVWKDAVALNRSAVEAYPNSARSNCFMGTALFNQAREATTKEDKLTLFHEADGYLDHSISIYPLYYNALKMKVGVAAELFAIDRDIDKLLGQFEKIGAIKPNIDYLHEYCEYLNKTGQFRDKLMNFYYRLGYERLALEKGNYTWGLKFLDYARILDPNNRQIATIMIDLLDKSGKTNQANYLRQQFGL